jgi:hypothetical protein
MQIKLLLAVFITGTSSTSSPTSSPTSCEKSFDSNTAVAAPELETVDIALSNLEMVITQAIEWEGEAIWTLLGNGECSDAAGQRVDYCSGTASSLSLCKAYCDAMPNGCGAVEYGGSQICVLYPEGGDTTGSPPDFICDMTQSDGPVTQANGTSELDCYQTPDSGTHFLINGTRGDADCLASITWAHQQIACTEAKFTGQIGVPDLMSKCVWTEPADPDGATTAKSATTLYMDFNFGAQTTRPIQIGPNLQRDQIMITSIPFRLSLPKKLTVKSSPVQVQELIILYYERNISTSKLEAAINFTAVEESVRDDLGLPTRAIEIAYIETGVNVTVRIKFVLLSGETADGFPDLSERTLNLIQTIDDPPPEPPVETPEVVFYSGVVAASFGNLLNIGGKMIATATLTLATDISEPYRLTNPQYLQKPTGISEAENGWTVEGNGVDFVTMILDDGDTPVCNFNGEYQVQFDVECTDGSGCLGAAVTVNMTYTLDTGNHCLKVVNVALQGNLVTYGTDTYDQELLSFTEQDQMFAKAEVRSEGAVLTDAVITAIKCVSASGTNTQYLDLYKDGASTVHGQAVQLAKGADATGLTDPADLTSHLDPTFDLVAVISKLREVDADANIQLEITVAVTYVAQGARRRRLLQMTSDLNQNQDRRFLLEGSALEDQVVSSQPFSVVVVNNVSPIEPVPAAVTGYQAQVVDVYKVPFIIVCMIAAILAITQVATVCMLLKKAGKGNQVVHMSPGVNMTPVKGRLGAWIISVASPLSRHRNPKPTKFEVVKQVDFDSASHEGETGEPTAAKVPYCKKLAVSDDVVCLEQDPLQVQSPLRRI